MTSKIKIAITSTIIAIIAVAGSFKEVKAYDIVTQVKPSGASWEWGSNTQWVQAYSNSQQGEVNCNTITGDAIFWAQCINNSYNNTWILKQVKSGNIISFLEGRYYKTQLVINVSNGAGDWRQAWEQVPQLNRLTIPSGAPYKLVSIEPVETSCMIHGFMRQVPATSTGEIWTEYMESCQQGSITYDVIVQATQTFQTYLTFGNGSAWFLQSSIGINTGGIRRGTIRPLTITEYIPVDPSTINQEQQQAGQQAQQEGQQGSDTSQNNVTQGTQSLLSAITGFVGVISNATPTNCRITGDMGALDLGELDFCQDNPPAIITTIGTLILIAITIPITIWVVKKIISLFRSFTNG